MEIALDHLIKLHNTLLLNFGVIKNYFHGELSNARSEILHPLIIKLVISNIES